MGDLAKKNMRVVVRVRPFSRTELEQNQVNIIQVVNPSMLVFDPDEDEDDFFFRGAKQTHRDITKRVRKKLNMEFDDVFDACSTNSDIFKQCMRPLVNTVMDGYNSSVFVYGATGAGKTYTMLGNADTAGITFLTMQELFDCMAELSEERKFDIGISYLEVYNEQVMNLLTKSEPLKLCEDANGVAVGGLSLLPIHNVDELLNLLALGNRNRTQHPTDANLESSRSHAIFQVHIRMVYRQSKVKRTVKLSMIDLAGSERAASTRCIGTRFKEGASINKSLLALGNCINKLADGLKHIPYRDSKLTRILKDSLGGNCRTVMIANVSPSSLTFEDTYNTLKYASRAKKIRMTVTKNAERSNLPIEYYVRQISTQADEIERLQAIIKRLEERPAEPQPAVEPPQTDLREWYAKIDAIYAQVRSVQEKFLAVDGQEKVLRFRIKLSEHVKTFWRSLKIDETQWLTELSKLGASLDKFKRQQQKYDTARWQRRYMEALRALDDFKNGIVTKKMDKTLETYMQAKGHELDMAMESTRLEHLNKIHCYYKAENDYWRAVAEHVFEISYTSYATNPIFVNKAEMLVKLWQTQTFGKTVDEQVESEVKINGAKVEEHSNTESSRKRQHLVESVSSLDDEVFLKPSVVGHKKICLFPTAIAEANRGETGPLESVHDDDKTNDASSQMNATFDLCRGDQPATILTENSTNAGPQPQHGVGKSILKKTGAPPKGPLMPRNVDSKTNKENKFTTNRVNKIQKPVNRVAAANRAAAILSRFRSKPTGSSTSSGSEPDFTSSTKKIRFETKITK